jgi:hypothetical protein
MLNILSSGYKGDKKYIVDMFFSLVKLEDLIYLTTAKDKDDVFELYNQFLDL